MFYTFYLMSWNKKVKLQMQNKNKTKRYIFSSDSNPSKTKWNISINEKEYLPPKTKKIEKFPPFPKCFVKKKRKSTIKWKNKTKKAPNQHQETGFETCRGTSRSRSLNLQCRRCRWKTYKSSTLLQIKPTKSISCHFLNGH